MKTCRFSEGLDCLPASGERSPPKKHTCEARRTASLLCVRHAASRQSAEAAAAAPRGVTAPSQWLRWRRARDCSAARPGVGGGMGWGESGGHTGCGPLGSGGGRPRPGIAPKPGPWRGIGGAGPRCGSWKVLSRSSSGKGKEAALECSFFLGGGGATYTEFT